MDTISRERIIQARNWKLGIILVITLTVSGLLIQLNWAVLIWVVLAIASIQVWSTIKTQRQQEEYHTQLWLNIEGGRLSIGNDVGEQIFYLDELSNIQLNSENQTDIKLEFLDGREISICNFESPEMIMTELSKHLPKAKVPDNRL